tara:strand:- start:113 stop:550 length:438 start_codon:yes stop_codon:yes gene_type:complete
MKDFLIYKKETNMKNLFIIILFLFSTQLFSQQWIDDSNFDEKIHKNDRFDDDETVITVIEFWVEFNKVNAFPDWDKLDGVEYFRVDIQKAPEAKKEFKVRMAPTIIIFKNGIKEEVFKASLSLECPITLTELQEEINDIKTADRF